MSAEAMAAFLRKIAGMGTHAEAMEEAGDDYDVRGEAHEDFLVGIEDDWDEIVLGARSIIDTTEVEPE